MLSTHIAKLMFPMSQCSSFHYPSLDDQSQRVDVDLLAKDIFYYIPLICCPLGQIRPVKTGPIKTLLTAVDLGWT